MRVPPQTYRAFAIILLRRIGLPILALNHPVQPACKAQLIKAHSVFQLQLVHQSFAFGDNPAAAHSSESNAGPSRRSLPF